jgi:hypothetical protein
LDPKYGRANQQVPHCAATDACDKREERECHERLLPLRSGQGTRGSKNSDAKQI